MTVPLPRDATLHDLRISPSALESFGRKVIGVMRVAQRDNGEIVIRMGITGSGIAPNYRIEKADGQIIDAIDGATHRSWSDGSRFDSPSNWSATVMSYADVEDVIKSATG